MYPNSIKYFVLLLVSVQVIRGQSPLQFNAREPSVRSHKGRQSVVPKLDTNVSAETRVRLPIPVIPSHYALEIRPILDAGFGVEQFTAPGKVVITVSCTEATDRITLHSSPILNITESSVEVKDKATNAVIPISGHEYNKSVDFYTIVLNQNLFSGKEYLITIEFVAPVSTDLLSGLYRAQFTLPGSTDINYMAVTQFAATYARQAFPCFDEPNLKAYFDVKIGRHQNYRALSNSVNLQSDPIPGMPDWFWDTFNRTEKMSTYLVAIVVAPEAAYTYEEADQKLPGDKPVRIYAPKDMIDRDGGVFAGATSARVMTFYENYFQMAFKMPKMDSATIPSFTFGAMENFGLITYREPLLLFFEGETTETERRRISSIIAHESSHQWFGNVVTCKWWNQVWLNEGFATYLSYLGVNETHPEFEPFEHFLNDAFQLSMPFDSDPTFSHPVLNDALYPDQIFAYFDEMSYEKAGSLIRMMEGFLTPETLKMALQKYLVKMNLQGAEQDDLFQVLTEQGHSDGTLALDMTVKDIMDTWTKQPGFPLLRVTRASGDRIYVTQERFSSDLREFPSDLDPNQLWHVPVGIVTKKEPAISRVPKFWMSKDIILKSYDHNTSEWIMINPDAAGYFRVLYDVPLTQLIQSQLETDHTVFSGPSRSQLLDDYFASAFHHHVQIETALELTKYLGKETQYYVWNAVFANLQSTYIRLAGTAAFLPFKEYLMPRLNSVIAFLGLEQPPAENGSKTIFRAQILDWACAMDISTCTDEADKLITEWIATPLTNPIPVDLQAVFYCSAVAKNTSTAYDFIFEHYAATTTSTRQRGLALSALACSEDPAVLRRLLGKTLEDEGTSRILKTDRLALVERVAANPTGRPIVISFLRTLIDSILVEFDGTAAVRDIIATLGLHCSTQPELTDLQNFINENAGSLADIIPDLNKSLEVIESNIEWMDSFFEPMKTWFEEQTNSSA